MGREISGANVNISLTPDQIKGLKELLDKVAQNKTQETTVEGANTINTDDSFVPTQTTAVESSPTFGAGAVTPKPEEQNPPPLQMKRSRLVDGYRAFRDTSREFGEDISSTLANAATVLGDSLAFRLTAKGIRALINNNFITDEAVKVFGGVTADAVKRGVGDYGVPFIDLIATYKDFQYAKRNHAEGSKADWLDKVIDWGHLGTDIIGHIGVGLATAVTLGLSSKLSFGGVTIPGFMAACPIIANVGHLIAYSWHAYKGVKDGKLSIFSGSTGGGDYSSGGTTTTGGTTGNTTGGTYRPDSVKTNSKAKVKISQFFGSKKNSTA